MNIFNVPKKVNRHVLKALNTLSGGNVRKRIPTAVIQKQVEYQMRDLVPVADLYKAVQKSLKNLTDTGLIARTGLNRFSIGRVYAPPATHPARPNAPSRRLFTPSGSRRRSTSNLDPNLSHPVGQSEESLSGDDIDRTRKRLRSNSRKLKRFGRGVELPKARKHIQYSFGYAYERGNDLLGAGPSCSFNHSTTSLSEFFNPRLETTDHINMGVLTTTLTPVRSLETIEITTQCQDSDCNYNANVESSNDHAVSIPVNTESVVDESAPKEQADVLQASLSTAATAEKGEKQAEETIVTENVVLKFGQ